MHAAALTSDRLRRVLALLRDGQPRSTRQIVRGARIMAVSACIAELRQHGAEISCRRRRKNGRWIYEYTMTKEPNA
ncbi:helix-turn-helix domain-containing protein [Limimaricola variabilis]|uniref:helix-turn-helix domain-containing protein n=1 Tax=Limimaricola variabilis TaxID=1492771 RepID=UPI002AC8C56B|nr:helix-turn-helix domain-containing protein [Limimaricola variabilis]WPY94707.1 helix-turn-helix domain-containing protein [Limimaricola variabilis]